METNTRSGHSRVSVSRTLSMRGPKPHRLLQAIPAKFSQSAPRTGIEPVFAWFRARCNDQQLPPRCKTIFSTPSGNRTRSAGFKGPRRVYAPERIFSSAIKAPADGLEPSLVSLTGSRLTVRPHRKSGSLCSEVSAAGFEPTIWWSQNTQIPKLSHTLR